ncbi:virulence RhuM family protein [Desulfovibrio sp. OttesenSCG-928-G15]|nr:virulence RhuM family protein [Desulfovibrio sp. OttesenSCG-928-G15]
MAELFQTSKQNIAKHLKAIFADGELQPDSVVNQQLTTAADGKQYRVQYYNLDAILAVGYRVRSQRGVQFRQWATERLSEYLLKGFTMDDERLKNPPVAGSPAPDYFDEMLERIRDIRASERRMCEIFALASLRSVQVGKSLPKTILTNNRITSKFGLNRKHWRPHATKPGHQAHQLCKGQQRQGAGTGKHVRPHGYYPKWRGLCGTDGRS